VGTSGSYGGSGAQRWQQARDRLNDLLNDASSGGSEAPVVQSIADALIQDDPTALTPDESDDLVLPAPLPGLGVGRGMSARGRGGSSGGGGGPGGSVRGRSSGSARSGTGGRRGRQISQGVRRGGLALGSAYALRRGDATALSQLGLNLGELQAMSPRQQRIALLNATVGAASHPDDVALRRAADEFLKQVLTAASEPEPADMIRDFVASYIFNVGLVEITKQLDDGNIDQTVALEKEREIRDWTRVRLRREDFGIQGAIVSLRDFQQTAGRLAATALMILRAEPA
jgi:hypothetical protein